MHTSPPWRVVVVDDEEDIRQIISLVLTDAGYAVSQAADGSSGVALCRKIRPQIVITDIRMPKMDGLQVLAAVKEVDPDIEVIVMTAFGEMDLAIKALRLDASDFINKPVSEEVLKIALSRAKDRYTARAKLKAVLHQDKMMSLGRLAASIVHEINNPLAGMLNYFRLMLRMLKQGDLSGEMREKFIGYLSLVETETDRLSKIVSNLLIFSRKAPPTRVAIDIPGLIDRSVLLCSHRFKLDNIRLNRSDQEGLPPILGDAGQLQQCLINLFFNAVDAMPRGGELFIDTHFDKAQNQVCIDIRDTGPGIAPSALPHIFEPFFTTKKEGFGVGLGLSTVHGIIQQHCGTIAIESPPGKGACFEIRLPAAPKEASNGQTS